MRGKRLHRRGALAVLFTGLAVWIAPGCSREDPGQSVILITIDTLRADHLTCYGYPRATSPELDRFLARGARFQQAFATSCRTAPSHVSLLTGLYPSFNSVDVENGKYPLNPSFVTLAEICRQAGMKTAAVVSNPVLSRRLMLHQGFETYDDTFPDRVLNRPEAEKIADTTVAAALRQLETLQGSRFFLWVQFQDPHGPYTPPDRVLQGFDASDTAPATAGIRLDVGQYHSGYQSIPSYQALGEERLLSEYIRRYDAEIRYLDEQLGRLFRAIESSDLLRDTLVVITADHGEAFGEEEFYCAHGHGLGLDQTHVPLGFVGPGIPPSGVVNAAVSNIDFFATALDALGLDGDHAQSKSLLSALRAGQEPQLHVGYAESVTQRAAFAGDTYLRIDRRPLTDKEFWATRNPYTGAAYTPLGEQKVVPLRAHPSDPEKLPAPARVAELSRQLDEFSRQADKAVTELDQARRNSRLLMEKEKQRLRALGYFK